MSHDLETVLRVTLRERAPETVPADDWPQLYRAARHYRRLRRGAAVAAMTAAAATAVSVPLLAGQPEKPTSVVAAPGTTEEAVESTLLDEAAAYDRGPRPAPRRTVEAALAALLAETGTAADDVAAARVLWSEAGPDAVAASQGPYALVGVRTGDEWVVGFWDERSPAGTRVADISGVHALPGDREPSEQLIAVEIDPAEYPDIRGRHLVILGPASAERTEFVVGDDPPMTLPDGPFGDIVVSPDREVSVRAVAGDGTVIAERRFG